MPLNNVPAMSIRCDGCDREFNLVPVRQLTRELHEAAEYGWECEKAAEGGPVRCPQCREEVEGG